jgi:hypothetical protein
MNRRMFMWTKPEPHAKSGLSQSLWQRQLALPQENWHPFWIWCERTNVHFWRPGMGILATAADERVRDVRFDDASIIVDLMDGRAISAPLAWYPRLLQASVAQRQHWELAGAGYGIHWPDLDEDLSTDGLLRGAPAPAR